MLRNNSVHFSLGLSTTRLDNTSMKLPALTLLVILIAISTAGAEDSNPRQRAEQFFVALTHGDTDKAYDQLFAGSIADPNSTQLEALKRQTAENLPKYGKPLGYEVVIEKTFGTSVVRLVYILKMEKHPVVFEFFFYRPKGTWFLANVRLNDEFNGLRDADSPKT